MAARWRGSYARAAAHSPRNGSFRFRPSPQVEQYAESSIRKEYHRHRAGNAAACWSGVCIRRVVALARGGSASGWCDVVAGAVRVNEMFMCLSRLRCRGAVRLYRNRCVRYTYSRCMSHDDESSRQRKKEQHRNRTITRAQRLSRTRVRATGPRAPRSGSAYPVAAPPCAPHRHRRGSDLGAQSRARPVDLRARRPAHARTRSAVLSPALRRSIIMMLDGSTCGRLPCASDASIAYRHLHTPIHAIPRP